MGEKLLAGRLDCARAQEEGELLTQRGLGGLPSGGRLANGWMLCALSRVALALCFRKSTLGSRTCRREGRVPKHSNRRTPEKTTQEAVHFTDASQSKAISSRNRSKPFDRSGTQRPLAPCKLRSKSKFSYNGRLSKMSAEKHRFEIIPIPYQS
jgi:hypothetical protein